MRPEPDDAAEPSERRVDWMGDSLDMVRSFPTEVREVVGQALRAAQRGGKHRDAKPLKGFSGASVMEIVAPFSGNAYRVIYALQVPDETTITVLHAFQKKSHRGIKTSRGDIDLIRQRLKVARRQGP